MGFSFYIYCIDRKRRVCCMIKLVEEKKEQRKQLNNRLNHARFAEVKLRLKNEVNQTDIVIIL